MWAGWSARRLVGRSARLCLSVRLWVSLPGNFGKPWPQSVEVLRLSLVLFLLSLSFRYPPSDYFFAFQILRRYSSCFCSTDLESRWTRSVGKGLRRRRVVRVWSEKPCGGVASVPYHSTKGPGPKRWLDLMYEIRHVPVAVSGRSQIGRTQPGRPLRSHRKGRPRPRAPPPRR